MASLNLFAAHFERQALQCGNSIAIEFEGRVWSYDEVNQQANQIARFLIDRAFQLEDRIGICMERSATAIIGLLGIMKSGCAFLHSFYSIERLGRTADADRQATTGVYSSYT